MEKSCRKCVPKASPRSLFNFAKQTKTTIVCKEFFLKIRCFERGLSKNLKKVNFIFFFRTQYLLMDKVIKKRRLELVSGCSSDYETS